jgi:hypothetical protein
MPIDLAAPVAATQKQRISAMKRKAAMVQKSDRIRSTPRRAPSALLRAVMSASAAIPTGCGTPARARRRDEPGAPHHVRVDAGHIKTNYRGWRYIADTPRHVKRSLMLCASAHGVNHAGVIVKAARQEKRRVSLAGAALGIQAD